MGGNNKRKTRCFSVEQTKFTSCRKNPGDRRILKVGYIIVKEEKEKPEVVLLASGSEVSLAVEVSDILKEKNYSARVVSIPEREEFLRQDEQYINSVLGPKDVLRVVIEVNNGQGWYQLLKEEYLTIFMKTFGKSAPGKEVADYFGFSPQKIADKIIEMVL